MRKEGERALKTKMMKRKKIQDPTDDMRVPFFLKTLEKALTLNFPNSRL
jgi:hypothetical protein